MGLKLQKLDGGCMELGMLGTGNATLRMPVLELGILILIAKNFHYNHCRYSRSMADTGAIPLFMTFLLIKLIWAMHEENVKS